MNSASLQVCCPSLNTFVMEHIQLRCLPRVKYFGLSVSFTSIFDQFIGASTMKSLPLVLASKGFVIGSFVVMSCGGEWM